jgi:hypothetical protein
MDSRPGIAPIADQEFSREELGAVDAIVGQYKDKPGALIPVLEEVQEAIGYLPKSIQKRIAESHAGPAQGGAWGGIFLLFFHHGPPRAAYHPLLPGDGLLCAGRQKQHGATEGDTSDRPGETTADRKLLPGNGALPGRVRTGAR